MSQNEAGFQVVVVGGGLAGLMTTIGLADRYQVALITKEELHESNTRYAQGGLAAVVGLTDSAESHIADTISAGAGHCRRDIVELCVRSAPQAVERLARYGVAFDRDADGEFELGKEGGHSHRRILHAGDATGQAIVLPLAEMVQSHPNITIFEHHMVVKLLKDENQVLGVECLVGCAGLNRVFGGHVILATGGCGEVFERTTNPSLATGDGLAIALDSGAVLSDMEFYQFHPTCLAVPHAPRFLISEALRGEGGRLLSAAGLAFMNNYDPAGDLAPRDVVARAIHAEMSASQSSHVYLDMSQCDRSYLATRFPNIYAVCSDAGIEMSTMPVPVAPAAHYSCGGITVDDQGATSVNGLSAVGEVACTGLHGANRLASNSLLEAAVFAQRLVTRLFESDVRPTSVDQLRAVPITALKKGTGQSLSSTLTELLANFRRTMWLHASIKRSEKGLRLAVAMANELRKTAEAEISESGLTRPLAEARNLALVGAEIATSALRRKDSIGLHFRIDE